MISRLASDGLRLGSASAKLAQPSGESPNPCKNIIAALSFDGATTAHSLFSYPVEDEDDIDDQNLPRCNFSKERCDFLHDVSVIFWDEFISNDRILIEAVLEEFKTRWERPRFYVFVCAGDFAQVSNYVLPAILQIPSVLPLSIIYLTHLQNNRLFLLYWVMTSILYSKP